MFHQSNSVELTKCLACGSDDLTPTLDLGNQPLANSYKDTKTEIQESYPLAINRCTNCYHVQLTHAVNPDLMYKNYLYVSGTSYTMRNHFQWFADYACETYFSHNFDIPKNVMDIGCNDGSQLNEFKNFDLVTFGIDPAQNLVHMSRLNGHKVEAEFLNPIYALRNDFRYDIIVAQNVFTHNHDPETFMYCVKKMMNENSLFFIQTSQADMILNNEFDTIYHEHISFYNINSMRELCQRTGMFLLDVIKCPLHGNSYIFVISKNSSTSRPSNIQNKIEMERKAGLLTDNTYIDYESKCKNVLDDFRKVVNTNQGKYKLVGYGAAAKGMTLLNVSGIQLDYIIDDNVLKHNKFTPGSSIEICSSDRLKTEEILILFIPLAWNFFDEIKTKIKSIRNNNQDKFCTYFPRVEISS